VACSGVDPTAGQFMTACQGDDDAVSVRCARPCEASATIAVTDKARELKRPAQRHWPRRGEPDFDTPATSSWRPIHAIEAGKTKYTAVTAFPS